jgi:hypothetical protein
MGWLSIEIDLNCLNDGSVMGCQLYARFRVMSWLLALALSLDRENPIGKGGWPPFDIKFLTGPLGGPSLWLFLRAF